MKLSVQPAHHAFSAILGGSGFVFGCRVTGAALTLLLQVLLARWMGADELGIYVLAFSWSIMLANLSQLGFVNATVRVIGQALANESPGTIRGYLRRGGSIVAGSSITATALGSLVVVAMGDSLPGGSALPYLLALASVPLLALVNFQCAIAVAFRWLPIAFVPTEVIRPIAIVLISAAIWWVAGGLGASSVLLIQATLMGAAFLALFVLVKARLERMLPSAPAQYDTPTWVQTALPLLLLTLFSSYFPELMLILLGGIVPSDQIAIFNASYRLALVVTFGLNAIDSVTSPISARLFAARKTAELQQLVRRVAQLGFFSSVAATVGFYFLGKPLLGLFGPEFVAGYETLMILVLAQVVRSAAGPVLSLMSVTGNQHRCLVVFGIALIGSAVLTWLLAPAYGVRGAAAAVLVVTLCWTVWLHYLVRRHLGIEPSIFGLPGRA